MVWWTPRIYYTGTGTVQVVEPKSKTITAITSRVKRFRVKIFPGFEHTALCGVKIVKFCNRITYLPHGPCNRIRKYTSTGTSINLYVKGQDWVDQKKGRKFRDTTVVINKSLPFHEQSHICPHTACWLWTDTPHQTRSYKPKIKYRLCIFGFLQLYSIFWYSHLYSLSLHIYWYGTTVPTTGTVYWWL